MSHKPSGHNTIESDVEPQEDDDDISQEDDDVDEVKSNDGVECEKEFDFTVSSRSSHDRMDDPSLTMSPFNDLLFKGKLMPIEPSSIKFNPSEDAQATSAHLMFFWTKVVN